MNFNNCYSLKPDYLILDELRWKFLYRGVNKCKNVLLVGPSGSGKTIAARVSAKANEKTCTLINMGSTTDPRSVLLGNTHLKAGETKFKRSTFIEGITTPNNVVILDEINRAHPDAWNILFSVLDPLQKFIRLDDSEDSDRIRVAEGVAFVATANIGSKYTSTRQLDRAILDRFSCTIEIPTLNAKEETDL